MIDEIIDFILENKKKLIALGIIVITAIISFTLLFPDLEGGDNEGDENEEVLAPNPTPGGGTSEETNEEATFDIKGASMQFLIVVGGGITIAIIIPKPSKKVEYEDIIIHKDKEEDDE